MAGAGGDPVNVDTSGFRALTDEVAILRDQVAVLCDCARSAAVRVTMLMAVHGLLEDASGPRAEVPARRPRHLQLVSRGPS